MGPPPAFPFPLDRFQLDAIDSLRANRSVVVCAPTGSGKTVVGEYAAQLALAAGGRIFYTTPLKALSNQKFRDFQAQFGPGNVGLLTGDTSIQGDAPLVVMTTEVFRNMLYGVDQPEGRLRDVRFVVLDECHYLNDFGRGTVWEESIIRCPSHIRLVALSATIANSRELTAWIDQIHGPTELVQTTHRPVPLRHHAFRRSALSPLLQRDGTPPPMPPRRPGGMRRTARIDPALVVATLHRADMLPAIYFVFSRRGCEASRERCADLDLLRPGEIARLEEVVTAYLEANPYVRDHPHLPYLRRGLAVHHAGLLPAWKVLVEQLFQANLIKVVFATETLAAGINMPARTTVISALMKRDDEGFRGLQASEFHQMSGRAGRRGMDAVGHVVVLPDQYKPMEEAARLAAAPPDPLISRFTPTYGLVLNLLRHHTPTEAEDLLRRSFGHFQAEARAARMAQERPDRGRRRRRRRGGPPRTDEHPRRAVSWDEFLALQRVLEEFDYIVDHRPTLAGLTAAALRTQNELLVAEVLREMAWESVRPEEFAAVVTALATEESRTRARVWARLSAEVESILEEVYRTARRLRRVQQRYRVDVPVEVNAICSGLTQRWAEGARWQAVVAATEMDEGDVVQVMRRTIDLLRQIPDAPDLPESLGHLARQAISQIDRPPVREIL
jgi:superfamily II RNA helicase